MRPRHALFAMLALSVGLAAWTLAWPRPTATPPTPAPTAPASPLATEPAPAVRGEAPAPTRLDAVAPAAAAGERMFRGTFVLERRDGSVDTAADAAFDLVLWNDRYGPRQRVTVTAGSWQAVVPVDTAPNLRALGITGVQAGGADVLLIEPASRLAPDAADLVLVRAREPRKTLLHVVDEATGAELANVHGVLAPPYSTATHPDMLARPRGLDPDGRALQSPVDLLDDFGLKPAMATVLVGADGYAWAPLTVTVGSGNESRIALPRAGQARIAVRCPDGPIPGVVVFVRPTPPPDAGELRLPLVGADPLVAQGLRPGAYEARAEAGPEDDRRVVATQAFVVAADRVTDVFLDVAAGAVPARAPVTGVLVLPPEWRVGQVDVAMLAYGDGTGAPRPVRLQVEPAAKEPDGATVFWFLAESTPPGKVELAVDTPRFRAALEVPPEGLGDVRIVVPPPGEVVVRLAVEGTGERLRPDQLDWCALGADESPIGSHVPMKLDLALDGYLLRAPVGVVQVMAPHDGGFAIVEPKFAVGRGRTEWTCSVVRTTELDFALQEGGAPVAFPTDWSARVFEGDAPEPLPPSWTSGPRIRRLRLPSGGAYRVEFDPLPGYAPLPPRTIEAKAGSRTRVAVDLVRKD